MISYNHVNMQFQTGRTEHFSALSDINFEINANELVILKGVSGSGKSTLLSLTAGLLKPTSGEILLDGHSIAKLPEHHASHFRASHIGFIFQSFNLFDTLSTHDNVSLPLIPLGLSQKEIDEKVQIALEKAYIAHKKTQLVRDLSGGEKQRTAIARALVNDPKIILCDEPTANLDRDNVKRFVDLLSQMKSMGKTIILATHDPLFEKLAFIDRIIPVADGKITL